MLVPALVLVLALGLVAEDAEAVAQALLRTALNAIANVKAKLEVDLKRKFNLCQMAQPKIQQTNKQK